jgi:hypothetical protein
MASPTARTAEVTVLYTPAHPRWQAAQRFAAQLNRALDARKMRPHQVVRAIGGGVSAFNFHAWQSGGALPTMARAVLLAEALDWPSLLEIAREARTGLCQRRGCGQTFTSEGGRTRIYCSPRCRQLAHEYDLHFTHASRKKLHQDAAEQLRLAKEHQATEEDLIQHRDAVAAFCNDCEPEGFCRDSMCAMRPVSPLPVRRDKLLSQDKRFQHEPHHVWGRKAS